MVTKRKIKSRHKPTTTRQSGTAKKTSKPKYVYYFGDGQADGTGKMKPLLGGKGANLAEMTRIGLPVPPGFTITTEVCTYFYENKKSYPPELNEQVSAALTRVEKSTGKRLRSEERRVGKECRRG